MGCKECVKKIRLPIFLDMVTDRVRSRLLAVVTMLALFTFVFTLVIPALLSDPRQLLKVTKVTKMDVSVPPSNNIFFGDALANSSRPLKIRVTNSKNVGIPGLSVTMAVSNLVRATVPVTTKDSDARAEYDAASFFNTNEDFSNVCDTYTSGGVGEYVARIVCAPHLNQPFSSSVVAVTDDEGTASFTSATLLTGYPGKYSLLFTTPDSVKTANYSITMMTRVASVTPLSRAPLTASIGVPFANPAVILVTDFRGDPVSGRTCLAYTQISSRPVEQPFALLQNNFATTNGSGIAVFTGMAFSAMSGEDQSIKFFCDAVTAPWKTTATTDEIRVNASVVANVTLLDASLWQSTIWLTEGIPLTNTLRFQVLDKNALPVSGYRAFAEVTNESPTYGKVVINGVSTKSDSNGILTFPGLTLSASGPVGIYTVNFNVNAVYAKFILTLNATTSVTSVDLIQGGLCTTLANPDQLTCYFCPVNQIGNFSAGPQCPTSIDDIGSTGTLIEVKNSTGFGVAGKTFTLSVDLPSPPILALEGVFQSATTDEGLIETINAFLKFLPITATNETVLPVIVSVDGVESDPINIPVENNAVPSENFYLNITIARIAVVNAFPPTATIGHPWFSPMLTGSPSVRVTSMTGTPIIGRRICMQVQQLITPALEDYFPLANTLILAYENNVMNTAAVKSDFSDLSVCPLTDNSGIAHFNGTAIFTDGASTGAHVVFYDADDLQAESVNMFSLEFVDYDTAEVKVTIDSQVRDVTITAMPPAAVSAGDPIGITVRITDYNGNPVVGVQPRAVLTRLPITPLDVPFFQDRAEWGWFGDTQPNLPTFLGTLTGLTLPVPWQLYMAADAFAYMDPTDASGQTTGSFTVIDEWVGRYGFHVEADNIPTQTVQVDVLSPVTQLSITQQPQLVDGCCLADLFDVQPKVQLLNSVGGLIPTVRNLYVMAEASRGDVVLFHWYCEAFNGTADWGHPLCHGMGVLATAAHLDFAIRFYYDEPGTGRRVYSAYTNNITIDDMLIVRGDVTTILQTSGFNAPLPKPIGMTPLSESSVGDIFQPSYANKVIRNVYLPDVIGVRTGASMPHPLNALTPILRVLAVSPLTTATQSMRLSGNVLSIATWATTLTVDPAGVAQLPKLFLFNDMQIQSGIVGPYVLQTEIASPWHPSLPVIPFVVSLDNTPASISLVPTKDLTVTLFQFFTAHMRVVDRLGRGVVGQIVSVIPFDGPAVPVFRAMNPVATQDASTRTGVLSKLYGTSATKSDTTRGRATFDALQFIAAPRGIYELKFQADKVLTPDTLTVEVVNPVESIRIVKQPDGLKQPFIFDVPSAIAGDLASLDQPVLQVLDVNGQPLRNIKYYIQVKAILVAAAGVKKPPADTSELNYDADQFGTTDTNGQISMKSLKFTDGNNAEYRMQFIVNGIKSPQSDTLDLINRQRPNQSGLQSYANYIYVTAAVITPFLLGNSLDMPSFLVFVAAVLVLAYIGLFNWMFAYPMLSLSAQQINAFGALLVILFDVCLIMMTVGFIMAIIGTITSKFPMYIPWRNAKYRELLKLLVPHGFKGLHANIFAVTRELKAVARREAMGIYAEDNDDTPPPPGCKAKCMVLVEAVKKSVRRTIKNLFGKKYNAHEPFEGKQAFHYSVRFLSGIAVGILFCIVAFLFCMAMLLWAEYAITVLGSFLTTVQLKGESLLRSPIFELLRNTNVKFLASQGSVLESYAASYGIPVAVIENLLDKDQIVETAKSIVVNGTASIVEDAGSVFAPVTTAVDDLYDQVMPLASTLLGQLADIGGPVGGGGLDINSIPTQVLSTMDQLRAMIDDFVATIHRAINAAGIVAAIVAFLATMATLFLVSKSYRSTVMLMRQGVDVLEKHKQHPVNVIKYIGLQIGCAAATFLLFYFVLAPVLFLIFWSPTRIFIWEKVKAIILATLAVSLVTKIILAILPKIGHAFATRDALKHPRLFFIFDLAFVFLGVVAAVTTVVKVVIVSVVKMIVNVARVDNPSHPAFQAYAAMVLLDHRYNNPIAAFAADSWIEELMQRRGIVTPASLDKSLTHSNLLSATELQVLGEGSVAVLSPTGRHSLAARRFWLALTLHNNPSIRCDRKKAIKAQLFKTDPKNPNEMLEGRLQAYVSSLETALNDSVTYCQQAGIEPLVGGSAQDVLMQQLQTSLRASLESAYASVKKMQATRVRGGNDFDEHVDHLSHPYMDDNGHGVSSMMPVTSASVYSSDAAAGTTSLYGDDGHVTMPLGYAPEGPHHLL